MYSILYTDEALQRIQKCDKKIQGRIKHAIEQLAQNPYLGKALTRELKGRWSYRVSDYRIIYRIDQEQILVLILTIGHRRDIYQKEARKQR